MITLTIDDREIEVAEGSTVLEAATRLGIYIPTLCAHEALEPYGACRLCMVEIGSGDRLKMVTACTYPVCDGLEVRTNSERVRKARRFITELLLARCPSSEEIRSLARRLGVDNTRLKNGDDDRKCILCGLCVRVCEGLIGKAAIGFINRGIDRTVETPFETQSEECIGCGACAFVCPTGAITIEDIADRRALKTWHTELEMVQCAQCGEYYTTLAVLDLLKEKTDLPAEVLECCIRCRRKKLGKEIGSARSLNSFSPHSGLKL